MCTGHVNSCPSHSGYVPPRTIVFGNTTVTTDDVIDLENEINQLLTELNTEAVRRTVLGKVPISLTLTNPVKTDQIRQVRDLYLHISNTVAVAPYTNTDIATGVHIKANTFETLKNNLITNTATCPCHCNYACTCNCNYCTCNCNYCTCNCNYCPCNCNYCACDCNFSYGCTCNCNHSYSCTCNCNFTYACTCNCNYACTCNCNYWSDIRLKTEITYF